MQLHESGEAHVLSAGTVYATHILSAVKLMYKRRLDFLPALLVMLTTQVLFHPY